jgi:phage shock protein C
MLYRNQNKGLITGVAAGIAENYDLSVTLVRSLFVISAFCFGLGIVAYLILSASMPDHTGQTQLDLQ